jgi:acyl-coenzyme A thioesterase PaaI-like protein
MEGISWYPAGTCLFDLTLSPDSNRFAPYTGSSETPMEQHQNQLFFGRKPVATRREIIEFMTSDFPQSKSKIEEVGHRSATVRRKIDLDDLRPGGTISGPVLMEVADVALYVAILGEIGIVPLAVTTNLSINFLRRPLPDQDILGVCKLLKVGRSLVFGEVTIYSAGNQDVVAHAVGTYSIPALG